MPQTFENTTPLATCRKTSKAYDAWLRSKAGEHAADSTVAALIESAQRLLMTEAEDWETIGAVSSEVSTRTKTATEETKRLRSDAVFYLKKAGVRIADIQEIFGVNAARVDQILKGVSGGQYQVQRYKDSINRD